MACVIACNERESRQDGQLVQMSPGGGFGVIGGNSDGNPCANETFQLCGDIGVGGE